MREGYELRASYTSFTPTSVPDDRVLAVTRIAIVDSQPAVRAGLTMLLRIEPGLVPVGTATGAHDGFELVGRVRPAVVLVDDLSLCRRLKTLPDAPRVIFYAGDPDGEVALLARIASADGLVDKEAEPEKLFEAIRVVARGGFALPPLGPEQLESAAHAVDPEDLALLAMLADGTPDSDAADTLRLDPRKVGGRVERLLGRVRAGAGTTVAA
jgi:DNA-binding NarL/FixJ family response regulator